MKHEMLKTRGGLLNPGGWSLEKEFSRMQRELDQSFAAPACDVEETETEYLMAVEMPGIPREKIKVEVKDRELTVEGERGEEHETVRKSRYLVERYHGHFKRVFALPDNADADQILAGYENGVLKIAIPKSQATKTRQVKITDMKPMAGTTPASKKLS